MIDFNTTRDRLKLFRKELSMTQRDMAEKLGIASPSYNVIETGSGGISETHIIKLLEMGLDLNWLYLGEGTMFRSSAINQTINGGNRINSIVNHGVVGDAMVNMNAGGKAMNCEMELALARKEIEYLKQKVADKEDIIGLLKKLQA